jgi:hypothetical protein
MRFSWLLVLLGGAPLISAIHAAEPPAPAATPNFHSWVGKDDILAAIHKDQLNHPQRNPHPAENIVGSKPVSFPKTRAARGADFQREDRAGHAVVTDRKYHTMWAVPATPQVAGFAGAHGETVGRLNANAYAGCRDWRMPSVFELLSLMTADKSAGYYLPKVFGPGYARVWSADISPIAGAKGGKTAWDVDYVHGYVGVADIESADPPHQVLAVRDTAVPCDVARAKIDPSGDTR